ncbi:MAG TPA: hypothetical protein VK986_08650, partial [Tepidisphaeraceae bacterium]|nr:hypothetical protein [Tepidisphaeraceae bacterium]
RVRFWSLLFWVPFLALALLLPDTVLFAPSLGVLDAVLWPLVRWLGKPGAVAVIAAGLAVLTMLGQKFLTDNDRLRVAKRRAALLQREAAQFPADSPRARALRAAAAPVQSRILGAAMLPIALLLGPMVMVFFWLPARVDPLTWSPPAGKSLAIDVVATVKTDHRLDQLTIDLPPGLTLDSGTPATQPTPQVRRVLEKFRDTQLKPSDVSTLPWELRQPAEQYRQALLADLAKYLEQVPPQAVTWRVITPENVSNAWPFTVRGGGNAGGTKTLSATIVIGDRHPPAPAQVDNTPNDPLQSLAINYPPAESMRHFWTGPIKWLGGFDPGWLTVYLLAYLPAMFGLRAMLRIA